MPKGSFCKPMGGCTIEIDSLVYEAITFGLLPVRATFGVIIWEGWQFLIHTEELEIG